MKSEKNTLPNHGIEKRVGVGVVVIFFLFLLATGIQYWGFQKMSKNDQKILRLQEVDIEQTELIAMINRVFLNLSLISYSRDTAILRRTQEVFASIDHTFSDILASGELNKEEETPITEALRNWGTFKNKYASGALSLDYSEFQRVISTYLDLITVPLYSAYEKIHRRMEETREEISLGRRRLNTTLVILMLFGLLGLGVLAVSLHQMITNFLNEREGLYQAIRSSATQRDLEKALETVLLHAVNLTKAKKAGIFLVDRETYEITESKTYGLSDEYVESVKKYGVKLPGASAVLENKVVVVPDILKHPSIKAIPEFYEIVKNEGVRAYIVVPLTTEEGSIGALTLYRTTPHAFTEKDIEIAKSYAFFAGNILQRLYQVRFIDKVRKRYQDLFTNVPIGLYRSTPEGKLLDVNPALLKILGYPDAETLKNTPLEKLYVNPEDRKTWMEALQKEGVLENFEYRLYKSDGTKVWVSDSARVICSPTGEPLYYEGSLRDITQRKIAEKNAEIRFRRLENIYKLISSLVQGLPLNEIFKIALESIKEILGADKSGILLLDENGIMRWRAWVDVSEEYRKVTEGHNPWKDSPGKFEPITIKDISDAKELSEFKPYLEKDNIKAIGFFPITYRGRLLGKFMVYYSKVHEFNEEEIQAGLAFAENLAMVITRTQMEHHLQTLTHAIQTSHDAVVVTDKDSRILYVNPAWEKITGYKFDEAKGKTMGILKSGKYDEKFYKKMYEMLKQGQPFRFIFLDKRKDGTTFYFDETISPVIDKEGNVTNYISIGSDATDRIKREQKIAERRERMELQHKTILEMVSNPWVIEGEVESALEFIVGKTAETINADLVTVWQYNRAREKLLPLARYLSKGDVTSLPNELDLLKYPNYIQAIKSGLKIVSSNLTEDERVKEIYREYFGKLRVVSVIDIPIRVKGEVMGILCVGSTSRRVWTEDEVSFVSQVADIISQVFLNQEIHGYTRELEMLKENLQSLVEQRTKDLRTLYEISQDISTAITIEDMIEIASEGLYTLINYDVTAFLFHKPPESVLYLHIARPISDGIREELINLLSNLYYQQREAWINFKEVRVHEYEIPDYPTKPETLNSLSTIFHMPIFAGAELVGFVVLGKEEEIEISPEQAQTLYTFSWQLSQALERILKLREAGLEQISKVLELMPQGIVLLDRSLRIQLANPLAREILRKIAKIDDSGCLVQIGDRDIRDFISQERRVLTQEVTSSVNNEERHYMITTKIVTLPPAEEACLITIRDITKEKVIQMRVTQQDRLASIGQLAAGVAHDFNNILQGIMGYAEVIKLNENIPEDVKNQANIILEQGRRAATLVRQILDFSRKTIVKMQPIDLHSFMNDVVALLKRTLPETIKVTLDIEPDGSYIVQGSPPQLQQVFTNIATNARDAMPEGGELMFRLSKLKVEEGKEKPIPELTTGEWVVIGVTDTGHGIPPEILPRIFEPFFTTKSGGVGTGLGLAQVYGIIRQHNGFIYVKSVVGKGSTFYIYLPVMTELKREPHEMPEVSKITEVPMKGAGVLFLDDDLTVLNVGKRMLEDLGYKVFPFSEPEKAIQRFSKIKDEVELVITDLTMPGMSGLDLYYKLKDIKPDVKVVLISGYALEDMDNLISQGISGFLPKPFTLNDVKSMLYSVLSNPEDSTEKNS